MQQENKRPRLSARSLGWGVVALVVAALLVFTGAAFAQATQPQTDTTTTTTAAEAPKPDPGLVVIHVVADGPAATAGVARGDIILAVDDDAVNTLAELRHVISTHDSGDVVVLKVMHGDEEKALSVTLGDNNGFPELGLMAVGDLAVEKRMEHNGPQGFGMPGRGGRQGRTPAMPLGRGQMQGMPGMPFGRGEGMQWMEKDGALVVDVMDESAAAAAGLQAGDVITALDDVAITSSDELIALLGDHKPGDVVTFTYIRDDETVSAEATLGAHPDDETKAYLGVRLAPVGMFHFESDADIPMQLSQEVPGVFIASVVADGPAAEAGIREGFWIVAIDGKAISNSQDLVDAVKAAKPGDEMVLTLQPEVVQPGGSLESTEVTVVLGENPEGGAMLGIYFGDARRLQRGPGGMDFDFHQFYGEQNGGRGMPAMPFFFGRPNQQDGGGRFEFRVPQFRFQTPGNNDDTPATPDARYQQQPGYTTEGA